MSDPQTKALVVFSGGQDSTTCLALSLSQYDHVETIGFHYGQRHAVEMDCRPNVLRGLKDLDPAWASRLHDDHLIDLSALGDISDTALTAESEIAFADSGLPNTFVPARNLAFLTFAGAVAYRRGISTIVMGVCETDYSGYPDCRDDTMKAMQSALSLGLDRDITIETPLMWIDKQATWQMAHKLGGQPLIDLIIDETHTCYLGNRESRHDWGYGCGRCPACELRAKGYKAFRQA